MGPLKTHHRKQRSLQAKDRTWDSQSNFPMIQRFPSDPGTLFFFFLPEAAEAKRTAMNFVGPLNKRTHPNGTHNPETYLHRSEQAVTLPNPKLEAYELRTKLQKLPPSPRPPPPKNRLSILLSVARMSCSQYSFVASCKGLGE